MRALQKKIPVYKLPLAERRIFTRKYHVARQAKFKPEYIEKKSESFTMKLRNMPEESKMRLRLRSTTVKKANVKNIHKWPIIRGRQGNGRKTKIVANMDGPAHDSNENKMDTSEHPNSPQLLNNETEPLARGSPPVEAVSNIDSDEVDEPMEAEEPVPPQIKTGDLGEDMIEDHEDEKITDCSDEHEHAEQMEAEENKINDSGEKPFEDNNIIELNDEAVEKKLINDNNKKTEETKTQTLPELFSNAEKEAEWKRSFAETKRKQIERETIENEFCLRYPSGDMRMFDSSWGKADVYNRDVLSLDTAKFVNDNIIHFFITYIIINMERDLKKKTHFFNTHFFNALTKKVPMFSSSPESLKQVALNMAKVVKWNKKIDLFSKQFLVVPVNSALHWLLAIIVNPQGAIVEKNNEEESRKKPKTFILFFDSLNNLETQKNEKISIWLQKFLMAAYEKRFGTVTETIFDSQRIETICPKNLPIQKNYRDCGPYIMYYMDAFFMDRRPVEIEEIPTLDWKERFPMGEERADIMRFKVRSLMMKRTLPERRSRLEKFEKDYKCDISRYTHWKARHHSCDLTLPSKRNSNYLKRSYSIARRLSMENMEQSIVGNPRKMMNMECTRFTRAVKPFDKKSLEWLKKTT